jgi:Protein of unknown function (DUF3618)
MSTQYGTDPGSKSPQEVQREVQQSRADAEETLEAIQERLSPGQMFEQVVDYMRSSNGSDFVRNLGTMVRDNPVPVALVGTGLVWLMLSSSRSTRRQYDGEDDLPGSYGETHYGGGLSEDARQGAGWSESASETARDFSEGARAGARSVRDRAGRLGASARHRVSEAGEQLWQGARDAGDRAGYYGQRARRGFFDTLHEQPLVLGALGLAAGAAIGAALPKTEREDEWLGESRDLLKERAKEVGWEQVERARAAAGAAYSAAREEAERQGLTLEGGKAGAESAAEAVRDKAKRVAEAATKAAQAEAEWRNPGQIGSKDA